MTLAKGRMAMLALGAMMAATGHDVGLSRGTTKERRYVTKKVKAKRKARSKRRAKHIG